MNIRSASRYLKEIKGLIGLEQQSFDPYAESWGKKPGSKRYGGHASLYIWVDDEEKPSLKLWGTEDFFGGSFYFCKGPYAGPYSVATVLNHDLGRAACYRLFIHDAVPFKKHIRVILNHGEHFNSGPICDYDGTADYSSVAYWYQIEPHDSSIYQGHAVEDRLPLNLKIADNGQLVKI